jgi:GT2 family glycosyltransferase
MPDCVQPRASGKYQYQESSSHARRDSGKRFPLHLHVRDLKRKAEGRHRIDLRDRLDGVQNLFGQRFFQPKRRGILPEETTMIEIARQKFGVIGFDRLQIPPAYAGFGGNLREISISLDALAANKFTCRRHSGSDVRVAERIILQLVTYTVPQISVIVVNWNRGELLRSCLQSLSSQQNAPAFEVIVVDNGSTDGSIGLLQKLRESVAFPLKIIENNCNRGFCAANNQGIQLARGEWIALLNNDAEAHPDWLAAMRNAVSGLVGYGMVACKILVYEDRRKIDKAGHLIYPDGQNRGRGSGQIDRGQFDRMEDALWPDGCAAMYRASMLRTIGGFDEDLFAYGDDAELGMRARIAGWKCLYVPDAVVFHRRGSTLGLFSSRRIELIERNRILLAIKHFPVSLLALNAGYCGIRLAAGLWAAARGRGEAARFPGTAGKLRIALALFRGGLQGLAMIPATLRKRRAMREIRKLSSREIRRLLLDHRISLKELSEQAV